MAAGHEGQVAGTGEQEERKDKDVDVSRRDFLRRIKDWGLGLGLIGVIPKTLDTLWDQKPIVLEGELLDLWVSAYGPLSGYSAENPWGIQAGVAEGFVPVGGDYLYSDWPEKG